jgi:hypothetical protein
MFLIFNMFCTVLYTVFSQISTTLNPCKTYLLRWMLSWRMAWKCQVGRSGFDPCPPGGLQLHPRGMVTSADRWAQAGHPAKQRPIRNSISSGIYVVYTFFIIFTEAFNILNLSDFLCSKLSVCNH